MTEFGRLVEQEIPSLRRYARALLRNQPEADDLVQNCLAQALAKQHLWEPGTNLRAWLFTMLHNLHVSTVRRSLREQKGRAGLVETPAWTVPRSPAPDARVGLRDIERVIAGLSEDRRRVLLLIGLEDYSYEEAAHILGVPVGTVRSRLGRARAAIRLQLSRQENEGAIGPGPVRYAAAVAAAPLRGLAIGR
jgi:RNA polymerase sigma-70 factor, ECF subfamily